tara:strand:+ start:105 stop:725 length:621 start_codon:yes stop_codon:yes gene_type:complete
MGLPKKLTDMQMSFAHELVTNEGRKTAYECAIDAGYSKDRARATASELKNPKLYPLVVQYIGELREEYQKKYDVTFERHITELAKLRDEARDKKAWSAAVNAEVARGKAAGLYVEQKIIRTGKLEDLSAEQLESRMKEIINEYSPILEGVEVEELTEKVKSTKDRTSLTLPKQVSPVLYEDDQLSSESDIHSSSSSKESSSSSSEA